MEQDRLEPAGRFRSAGFFMVSFIVLLALLTIAMPLLFGGVGGIAPRYLISAAGELALAVPAVIYVRVRRIRLSGLFGRAQPSQVIAAAFAGMLAVPVCMALGVLWELAVAATGGDIAAGVVPVPENVGQLAAALLAAGVAAPLVEEPVYRGLVLGAQASVFDKKKAVLFTAALFALIHGRFIALPSIFLAGVMLTALAWHSGSVWPSVAAHAAYNAVTMIFAALMRGIAANMPMPQGYAPGMVPLQQLAASAAAWMIAALPFAAGLAAVLAAYFRHTPKAGRIRPDPAARLGLAAVWPWIASVFLLFCYLAIDVLQVYGIIKNQ